jgi:glucose/arabinose dehydrogenase
VVRILVKDGRATGEYEDFMTGFALPNGTVWGRPVGVAVAQDGALIVPDDGSKIVWRIRYKSHSGSAG